MLGGTLARLRAEPVLGLHRLPVEVALPVDDRLRLARDLVGQGEHDARAHEDHVDDDQPGDGSADAGAFERADDLPELADADPCQVGDQRENRDRKQGRDSRQAVAKQHDHATIAAP